MSNTSTDTKKRVRDPDSPESLPESKISRLHSYSPESHLTRTESISSEANENSNLSSEGVELGRVDSAGSISDDLLMGMLDDSENAPGERDPTFQGLDSVIKSFEDEILASGSDPVQHEPSDLQHLLEASDDELGLPPVGEEKPEGLIDGFSRTGPDGLDLSGFLGFEDDIEGFGYGNGGFLGDDNGGGFVTLDGLFDYADSSSSGDVLWRSESLQAM